MKTTTLLIALFLGISHVSAQLTSFTPGTIWKDNNGVHINAHGGGILYQEGTYYWFGEHKTEGRGGNVAQVGVHCYSSTDLYNWTDRGIAFSVSDDPASDIEKGCILERPKVIYNKKTGKYVMWFHLEPKGKGYGGALVGIAQADEVTGPYTFIRSTRATPKSWPVNVLDLHKRPVPEKYMGERANLEPTEHPDSVNALGRDFVKGQHSRDMTLFVDDDGKAYHIFSAEENLTLNIAELTDDYLDYTGRFVRVAPGGQNEAPTIFKRGGAYWMITSGCTGWAPNEARMFRASSVWGPWEQLPSPFAGEGAEKSFHSQGTYVLKVEGVEDGFIFMADRWNPESLQDSRYVWLPIVFGADGVPVLRWLDSWSPAGRFVLPPGA